MLLILMFLSEVVISHFYSTNVDSMTWRQEVCTHLARAWDTGETSSTGNAEKYIRIIGLSTDRVPWPPPLLCFGATTVDFDRE